MEPEIVPRPEKVAAVEEIRAKLLAADAAVLTEYRGLSVGDLVALRGALRPIGTEYKVFKNTLARRAVEAAGYSDLLPLLEGPVAIAFVHGDAAVAAKAMRDFARDHDALVFKGGVLGDRSLEASDVEELAKVPPRDVILGRLAGGFRAPLTKTAGLFQAFVRNFAYGIRAYADQRAAEAPSEAPAPASADDGGDRGAPEPETTEPEAPSAETVEAKE